jgi:EAL domain-containing protein (putative c-di-GMP-specific phosphodiesterase class I)
VLQDEVLQDADYAMYRAKASGVSRYEIFDNFMQVHFSTQQKKEQELRMTLEKREFEVWYQPVYRLSDGCIEGFEALLRWNRFDGSSGSFLELLPVAEETGLMIPISREVIEKACLQLRMWMKLHPQPITMSVNISARQFLQPDLGDKIAFILRAY